jgi:hypothetical protein
VESVERIVDNRLASSSWRKVEAALNHWRPFAAGQGWPTIIRSNDPGALPLCATVKQRKWLSVQLGLLATGWRILRPDFISWC